MTSTALELLKKSDPLTAPSPAVIKLMHALNRPDSDADELVKLVEKDVVLTAKLLAVCNSAQCGSSQQIASVKQAIFFLGFKEIYRLTLAISFGGPLAQPLLGYAIEARQLWHHSLVTALATQAILSRANPMGFDPSVAYTTGLIHDIGKLVLNQVLDPDTEARIRECVEVNHLSRVEAERRVLETDHCEIGSLLLERWKLPEVLVDSTARHHEPPLEPQPQLSAVVHLANCLAHEVGYSAGWLAYAARTNEGVIKALGLQNEDVQQLLLDTHDALQQVEELAAVKE